MLDKENIINFILINFYEIIILKQKKIKCVKIKFRKNYIEM